MSDYSQTSTNTCQQDLNEVYPECGNLAAPGSTEQEYLMQMQTNGAGNAAAQEAFLNYGPEAPDYMFESDSGTFIPYGPPAPDEEEQLTGECKVDPFFQSPEEYREWYEWEGPFTDQDGRRYGSIEPFLIQSDDPEAWRILIARSERKQTTNTAVIEDPTCPAYSPEERMAEDLQFQLTEAGQEVGEITEDLAQYGSTYIIDIGQQEISLPPTIEPFLQKTCLVDNDFVIRSRVAATPEASLLNGAAMTKDGITQSIKYALGEVFSGLSIGTTASGQVTMRGTIGGEWAAASLEWKPINKYICRFEPKKLIEVSFGGWNFKIRIDASLIKTYWPDGLNDIDLQPINISPETQTIVLGSAGLLLITAAMLTGTGELALAGAAGLALVGASSATSDNTEDGERLRL